MKIARRIAKFVRRVLNAKSCQKTFIKILPGRLDKPHLILKSRKNSLTFQQYAYKLLLYCVFFLDLLFMKKEEKTNQQTK